MFNKWRRSTSSHVNKKTDKIHRCSKSEIIIPIGCYIVLSGSLVHGGSIFFVQTKGECSSCIRLFITIAENSYNINVCEMTHNLTKDDVWSDEYYICILFNNVSSIGVINLHQIIKIKEYKIGELVYGDLELCGVCEMKCQNMNNNKSIHNIFMICKTIPKNIVWVPLYTDVQRQTVFVELLTGNRFSPVKTLILIHWKEHMKKCSIVLWKRLMRNIVFVLTNMNYLDITWWEIMGLLKRIRLVIEILKFYNY